MMPDRERIIAGFKDKKSIDKGGKRRVDNIVRHTRPHLDKLSEDMGEWDKLIDMVDKDNILIEELLKAPGTVYEDIELFHYTGKCKRSNDRWMSTRKPGRCCKDAPWLTLSLAHWLTSMVSISQYSRRMWHSGVKPKENAKHTRPSIPPLSSHTPFTHWVLKRPSAMNTARYI
jgi:hypothetical protein